MPGGQLHIAAIDSLAAALRLGGAAAMRPGGKQPRLSCLTKLTCSLAAWGPTSWSVMAPGMENTALM